MPEKKETSKQKKSFPNINVSIFVGMGIGILLAILFFIEFIFIFLFALLGLLVGGKSELAQKVVNHIKHSAEDFSEFLDKGEKK